MQAKHTKRWMKATMLLSVVIITLTCPTVNAIAPGDENIMVLAWNQDTQTWSIPIESEPEPEIPLAQPVRVPYAIPPEENGVKYWMDYRTITCKTSKQWEIQHLSNTWTDKFGFRRVGDYYCVAMGTYYSKECGAVFEITLDSGFSFLALVSDIKRDRDTDATNRHKDGNVVEFVIDKNAIPQAAKRMGDMSYGGTPMAGKITSIVRIEGGV